MSPEAYESASTAPASGLSAREWSLARVVEAGRELLAKRLATGNDVNSAARLTELCEELLNHRGEASGLALANEITSAYQVLPETERLAFFNSLATAFSVDPEAILTAADAFRDQPDHTRVVALARAVEAPRVKLFRRMNTAFDGTATLVALRGHLLPFLRDNPQLQCVDDDLRHLFISWFNKGFLELRRIDWSSPTVVLEKIMAYEAVHAISGWDDLRHRLTGDRLCFGFFHPALANDPVVFVEVALTEDVPSAIAPLLDLDHRSEPGKANTVAFYSISNCHSGLAGVSFGNFLIKNVVDELRKELPSIKTFVTLSPVPGFRKWLLDADLSELVPEEKIPELKSPVPESISDELGDTLAGLCAFYLLKVKAGELPLDPVARFHLGNGARLHRINSRADMSEKGRAQSGGIMVNYLYDLSKIEVNHEAYFGKGKISVSRSVSRMLPV